MGIRMRFDRRSSLLALLLAGGGYAAWTLPQAPEKFTARARLRLAGGSV